MATFASSDFGQMAKRAGVDAVFGVPDSLMKGAVQSLESQFSPGNFFVAANEGSAVGMAIGHHLATGRLALVYLQNSGLGNALNPLISLADTEVYSIPLLLLVGWRAEILESGHQKTDEPQHVKQGKVTVGQLSLIGIPYHVLDSDDDVEETLLKAVEQAVDGSQPVAIVVRSGVLDEAKDAQIAVTPLYPSREEMIRVVASATGTGGSLENVPVVSSTGMISRELYECREKTQSKNAGQDFLVVGGMGHAISISSTIAKQVPSSKVVCLDGDGSILMHMGSLLHAAQQWNIIHIVLDNGVHDSVGGQSTGFRALKLDLLASSLGYATYVRATTVGELAQAIGKLAQSSGSALIHALCEPGHRSNLGRPSASPQQAKRDFVEFLARLRNSSPTRGEQNDL